MFIKLVILILASLAAAEDVSFIYNGFKSANLSLDGSAQFTTNGLLQLTNDSGKQIGHAFYPNPVTFKNSSNASAFSFSATFVYAARTFSEFLDSHGMAFVIAPTRGIPGADSEQNLGHLNNTNNGNVSNHVFAVELVTNQNSNYVGIVINGLSAVQSARAGYFAQENDEFRDLTLISGQLMQVWVEYDDTKKQINATLGPINVDKPQIPLLSLNRDLSPVLNQTMYVGFSSSGAQYIKVSHYVVAWSFEVNGQAQELVLSQFPKLPRIAGKKKSQLLHIGVPLMVISLVFLAIFGVIYAIKRKKKFAELVEDWELGYGPQRFKYKELYLATKGFKETELLGRGGFGKVFKGILPTTKLEIAVKRVSDESRQGMKEFVAEIVSNGRLRHRNLVPLMGYCRRKGELLLVYEYMPNGSLDKYLYGQSVLTLNWSQRFRILRDVASGLLYLHEEWEQVVVHRDVKASNVLLDREWNGRLGDFGLARLYDHGADPCTTGIAGTFGYLAPEQAISARATTSSDVFAFGVFLLEVACGRRPIETRGSEDVILVEWVISCWNTSNILEARDPNLGTEFVADEVELVLKLGILCSQSEPSARPRMRQIVQYLEGDIPLTELSLLALSASGLKVGHHEGFYDFANGKGFSHSSSVADASVLSCGR